MIRRHSCLVLLPLLLGACSGLNLIPQPQAVDIYRLPADGLSLAPLPANSTPQPWQLRIDTPLANGLIGSRRIAVIPEGDRISIYQGARWDQSTPELLQARLIKAFRNHGNLQAVFGDHSNLTTDFILETRIDDFQAEIHGNQEPVIVLGVDAMLVHAATNKVLASQRFTVNQVASDSAIPAIVTAFGEATDILSGNLVIWARKELSQASASTMGNPHKAEVPATDKP